MGGGGWVGGGWVVGVKCKNQNSSRSMMSRAEREAELVNILSKLQDFVKEMKDFQVDLMCYTMPAGQ